MKKTTFRAAIAMLLLQSILFANFASAQTTAPADINAQIRKEAMENSQIMRTIHFFTDRV